MASIWMFGLNKTSASISESWHAVYRGKECPKAMFLTHIVY